MTANGNYGMTLRAFILLTPLVFLAHDAEEVLTVVPWARAHREAIPAPVRGMIPDDATQFAAAVALLFAVLCVVAYLAARERRAGAATKAWLVCLAALVANAATHAGQAAYFGGYTPGVVTALVLVAPFGIAAWRRALAEGATSRRAIVPLLVAGLAIQVPIVVLALLFGRSAG